MSGFILEIALKLVHNHWKKYTLASAQSIIQRILTIPSPESSTNRSMLVDIAFAEFYVLAGFLNKDVTLLKKAISEHLFNVFKNTLGVDVQQHILLSEVNKDVLQESRMRHQDALKYALKCLCVAFFYVHSIQPESEQAYHDALACATAGILIFNIDTDFYNHYGLVHKSEKIKVGAFIKSNKIERNSIALDCLAFIYLRNQRYEEATNMFLKSIEVNTTNATAYIGLFIIQYNMAIAFQQVVESGNDDKIGTYAALRSQMLEKCGSYLHYVKQIEISASSVLFDALLEYMRFSNQRSHISYYFSTDLFDRAPELSETHLGTLYKMMILKQSSTLEKKLETLSSLKHKVDSNSLSKLLLEKSGKINAGFLEILENRLKE